MTDTERLDLLERSIREAAENGLHACVVLSAWYSKPGSSPDGYSLNVGDYHPDGAEYPSLRDAIDAELIVS